MTMRTFVIVMIVLEFLGTFGLGGSNISHICHFGGMLVGGSSSPGFLPLQRPQLSFRLAK